MSRCHGFVEFTDESSVCFPIIGLGTRKCGVAKRFRDPTVQCEFFARVSKHLIEYIDIELVEEHEFIRLHI